MEEVPLTNEDQIDQSTLECVTKSRIYCRCATMILSGFLYIFFILFPWISEIIVISQISLEHRALVVLVCGILQTLIAIYGGFKCGILIYESCNAKNGKDQSFCNGFWCGSITDLKTLFTGGYIIYFLPQWIVTNAIISWVIINHSVILPYYIHIMVYMPILIYPISLFIGYSSEKAMSQSDYQQL